MASNSFSQVVFIAVPNDLQPITQNLVAVDPSTKRDSLFVGLVENPK